jgi:Uma2 family endonuclease
MQKAAKVVTDPEMEDGVYYPSSDGQPMAETDFHILAIRMLLDALDDVFADRDDVYVAGNVNWYWKRGQPRRRRAPNAMVVFGVEKGLRRSFRSWNEDGAAPAVCFEIASARTWRENLGAVRDDYEANGVREYFIFDPTREYLQAPLLGFRRRGGQFHSIRPDAVGGMLSRELGLCLVPEGIMLRLVRPETGELVRTRSEQAAAERARASAATAQVDALMSEVTRLKARLRASGKSADGLV